VPFGPIVQYADEAASEPLSLVIYPGADGAFTLYEDDGRTFDYRRGAWMGIDIGWNDAAHRLTLRLTPGSRMRPPLSRTIEVRVAGGKTSERVTFSGGPVSLTVSR
jgi:alpha-glucosidase (family GH31 glycosyl hydrolase)